MALGDSAPVGLLHGGSAPVYHFTKIDNLADIVRDGCLSSDAALLAAGRTPASVAYEGIKERRRRTAVPCGPGGFVADYVPFYFNPLSPMLLAVVNGHVATHTGGAEPLVFFATTTSNLTAHCACVFCDGHPVEEITGFYPPTDSLEAKIDWMIMQAKYWRNTDADGDCKRRRQAEFLARDPVPLAAIRAIGVRSEAMAERVRIIIGATADLRILIRPTWYYPQ